jgi:putative transposase
MRVRSRPAWNPAIKRTEHSAEQIIPKLRTGEQLITQGKTVAGVCGVIEVTQPPYHLWHQQYGGMQAEETRRLTQLEKEHSRDVTPVIAPGHMRVDGRCQAAAPS